MPATEGAVSSTVAGCGDGLTPPDAIGVAAAGADRGEISPFVPGVSLRGDDVTGSLVNVCRSPARNLRHASELFARSFAVVVTAALEPNTLLVSSSSCPVIGSLLRIW